MTALNVYAPTEDKRIKHKELFYSCICPFRCALQEIYFRFQFKTRKRGYLKTDNCKQILHKITDDDDDDDDNDDNKHDDDDNGKTESE
jgi:hypothetical protein